MNAVAMMLFTLDTVFLQEHLLSDGPVRIWGGGGGGGGVLGAAEGAGGGAG